MFSSQPPVNKATAPLGGSLSYQSGYNANRQGINSGYISGRLGKESAFVPRMGSADGNRGIADLAKANAMDSQNQLQRGLESQNSQMGLQNSINRSELMQAGLSNQAKIYADMTQRATDQMGLAARLQESMIRNRAALMAALMG
jgi:hypothetical protein